MKKSASLFSMTSAGQPSATKSGDDANNKNKVQSATAGANASNNPPTLNSIDLVLDPPKPTLVTYSTLMSRAVSLGKPRVALRLWNLMKNQPNFYSNVISRRQREDGSRSVEKREGELLKELRQEEGAIVPDVIFCNTLMNAYAKLGEHAAARSILDAMLGPGTRRDVRPARHEGIPPTSPTAVTYNTLADACKAAGELGAALEVPELMTARAEATGDGGMLPDARTYTILISAVARKKKTKWRPQSGSVSPSFGPKRSRPLVILSSRTVSRVPRVETRGGSDARAGR